MQNRYVGDIGDYGKYGLLRFMAQELGKRLGVIWYLFPNETHNADGQHREYLDESKVVDFRHYDPGLYDKLKGLDPDPESLSVQDVRVADILPRGTLFFDEECAFWNEHPGHTCRNKEIRVAARREWLTQAMKTVSACPIVFLDPDNGLEIGSCPNVARKMAGKYVFYDEVNQVFSNCQVLIIYHHLNRSKQHGSHKEQIRNRRKELLDRIVGVDMVFACRFWPYSPRAYFVLAKGAASDVAGVSLKKFEASVWSGMWDEFVLPE